MAVQNKKSISEVRVCMRGGGDLATGCAWMLKRSGFQVVILETQMPAAVRRSVSFCDAVYTKTTCVEGIEARLCSTPQQALESIDQQDVIPLLIDPNATSLAVLQPDILIDAILAKYNIGTTRDMAPMVIGLGPGFCAPKDCDCVIETQRGHNCGRPIWQGSAAKNTGIPGIIAGHGKERVIRSDCKGIFHPIVSISDVVAQDELVAQVEDEMGKLHDLHAAFPGVVRGMLRDGFVVTSGFKCGDIDPRAEEKQNCYTISDKARCIAGGVLNAILQFEHTQDA